MWVSTPLLTPPPREEQCTHWDLRCRDENKEPDKRKTIKLTDPLGLDSLIKSPSSGITLVLTRCPAAEEQKMSADGTSINKAVDYSYSFESLRGPLLSSSRLPDGVNCKLGVRTFSGSRLRWEKWEMILLSRELSRFVPFFLSLFESWVHPVRQPDAGPLKITGLASKTWPFVCLCPLVPPRVCVPASVCGCVPPCVCACVCVLFEKSNTLS